MDSNREALRRHRKVDLPYATFCAQCGQSWPCDTWQATEEANG